MRDKVPEPGRGSFKIEIKRLLAYGAHDFIQQLAHHACHFRRIAGTRLLNA